MTEYPPLSFLRLEIPQGKRGCYFKPGDWLTCLQVVGNWHKLGKVHTMTMGSPEAVAFANDIAQQRKAEEAAKKGGVKRRVVTPGDMIAMRSACLKQAVAEVYGGRYMENYED